MSEASASAIPPPIGDPEQSALFGPRPEGIPADAPWPPPDMEMMGDSGIRDSGFVDSGAGVPAVPSSPSSSSSTPPSPADPGPTVPPGVADSALQPPPQNPPPTTQNPLPASFPAAGPVLTVDPATLAPHPYADLLPPMTEAEYRGLREAIRVDGQQVPAVLFEGRLLDGRNRCRACRELGLPLLAQPFGGTADAALVYVLSVNQHRRDLSKSQRAAVAATLIPLLSADIQVRRSERIRASLLQKGAQRIRADLPGSSPAPGEEVRARAIAADIMGVADRYVGDALRLQREAPDAFVQVRAGKTTLNFAITRLIVAAPDTQRAARLRAVRRRVNVLMNRAATDDAILARLEEFVGAATDDE